MNWNEFENFQNDPLIPFLSFTRKDTSFISMIVSKNYRCPIMQPLVAQNLRKLSEVGTCLSRLQLCKTTGS